MKTHMEFFRFTFHVAVSVISCYFIYSLINVLNDDSSQHRAGGNIVARNEEKNKQILKHFTWPFSYFGRMSLKLQNPIEINCYHQQFCV